MKKHNILIVDDESTNISVLFEILSEKYNILVATDGITALEIVNSDERSYLTRYSDACNGRL